MTLFQTVSKQGLSPRVEEARRAAAFAQVGKTNTAGKNVVIVPGHEGKRYQVILHRTRIGNMAVMQAECLIYTDRGTPGGCNGNCKSVCYHVMAAVAATGDQAGHSVAFCHSEKDASRVRNLTGGSKFAILSKQSGRVVWAISK